jgi:TolB-like protein
VNVAARLQAEADPGGIVISQSVQEAVAGRIDLHCTDLGSRRLKNIVRPVRMFQVETGAPPVARRRTFGWPRSAGAGSALLRMVGTRAFLAVAFLIVALVAGGWQMMRARDRDVRTGPAPETVGEAVAGKSVAVLAFEGVGSEADNQGFATGLSDELIATLSRVPGLKVAARTSAYHFKGSSLPVDDVARRLGVAYVVTGTVRKAGLRVKIAVQLLQAGDASPVWSREYARQLQDIFAVQAEIAQSVAANLQVKIGQAELVSGTADLEARRMFLQAQQILAEDPDGYEAGLVLLRQAVQRDPGFVQARLRRISAEIEVRRYDFSERDTPPMRALLAEAKKLAAEHPALFEAHATHALTLYAGWRFAEAAEAEARALQLGEGTAQAALLRVRAAAYQGRMSQALGEMRQAVAADPLAPQVLTQGAFLMIRAGQPAEALAYANQALELAPGARFTLALKALALARLGQREAALASMQAIPTGAVNTYFGVTALAIVGDFEPLEAQLRVTEANDPGSNSFYRAYLLLHLAHPERALDAMDVDKVSQGDFFLRMQYDPAWDAVRSTPRFRSLLATLGVTEVHDRAQAWRAANPPPPPFVAMAAPPRSR